MKELSILALALAVTPLAGVVRPARAQQPDQQQQKQRQQPPQPQADQQQSAQPQAQPEQPQNSPSATTFKGQIMQQDGKYVFEDGATNAVYQIDAQDKAKPFDGKEVWLTGNLDSSSSTIRVSEIQPSS